MILSGNRTRGGDSQWEGSERGAGHTRTLAVGEASLWVRISILDRGKVCSRPQVVAAVRRETTDEAETWFSFLSSGELSAFHRVTVGLLTVLRGRFRMGFSHWVVENGLLATFKSFLTLTSQYLKEAFPFEPVFGSGAFCCGLTTC